MKTILTIFLSLLLFMPTTLVAGGRNYDKHHKESTTTNTTTTTNINNNDGRSSNFWKTLGITGLVVCTGRVVYVRWTTGDWRMCFMDDEKPTFTGSQRSPDL